MGWATRLQLACLLAKAVDSCAVLRGSLLRGSLDEEEAGTGGRKFGISHGSLGIDCCRELPWPTPR